MLDKLTLTNAKEITLEAIFDRLTNEFTRKSTIKRLTKYHYSAVVLYRGEAPLATIHVDPVFPNILPTKVEINPSRFRTFRELSAIISKIDEPHTWTITRIDHAVDLALSIEEIRNTFRVKRKKWHEVYGNGKTLTGFTIGKSPERIVVYDKARELKKDTILSRVEISQHQNKVPIKKYSDLPKYLSYSPFQSIQIKKLNEDLKAKNDVRKKNELEYYIKKCGVHRAFKMLNENSNFLRDYGKVFIDDKNAPCLNSLYQENLSQFFC